MFKKSALFLFSLFFAAPAFAAPFSFTAEDKVLVIAPHPDDEALGCGGAIQAAKAAKASVRILYLTNGEANEISALFYQKRPLLIRSDFLKNGLTRQKEAVDAMAHLGLGRDELIFFGYPDGGLLNIWVKYWAGVRPFRSLFTRYSKVPYAGDFSYGRAYRGDEIVRDLEKVLLSFEPTQVFVTAPFDLNNDHRASYLYFQVALLNLEEQLQPAPQVHLYVVHAHRWPQPKQYLPEAALEVPQHIDWQGEVRWESRPLDKGQTEKKKEAILKYQSQIAYKKSFLLSFARANELFTDYPKEKLMPSEAAEMPEAASKSGDVVYRLVGKELWLEIPLTSALDEMGMLSASVFGYRKGFLFSEMPKLSFKLFGNKMFVYNGSRPVYDPSLVYKVEDERLWLRIPRSYLKDPDILFVSTRNTAEELSLDFGSWKVLELAKPPVDSPAPL